MHYIDPVFFLHHAVCDYRDLLDGDGTEVALTDYRWSIRCGTTGSVATQ